MYRVLTLATKSQPLKAVAKEVIESVLKEPKVTNLVDC
jgi:hypothetical protein